MDAAELAANEEKEKSQLSFGQLGLRASRLKLPYYRNDQEDQEGEEGGQLGLDSGDEADDERTRLAWIVYTLVLCMCSTMTLLSQWYSHTQCSD